MTVLVVLVVVVALALVIVGGSLLVRTSRRSDTGAPAATPTIPPMRPPEVAGVADIETAVRDMEAPAPLDIPEPVAGRLARLRQRLAGSDSGLSKALFTVLSRDALDDATWDELEAVLIRADVGVGATTEIVDSIRKQARTAGLKDPQQVRGLLRTELLNSLDPSMDREVHVHNETGPAALLVVGVNGTGKTTTCGKLARVLIAEGSSVVLGAADTFRAAASEQLETWGERVGAHVVRGADGADPASVAFDAVSEAKQVNADCVIIDTAGRLQTKAGLMDELGKLKRVVDRQATVTEVLLVLDATTGQNGLTQARVFGDVVDVTGIVLTKLDGSAKGGIVIGVQRELGVPVKLVGLGEGPDDLAPFDPTLFVDVLVGD